MNAIQRLLMPIRRRIQLMIGRCILTAIDNTEKTQKVTATVLTNETIANIERLEDFGLTSYPVANTTEGLILFLGGNRDFGVLIKAHSREGRDSVKSELEEGAVILYGKDSAGTYTNRILIKPTDDTIDIKNKTGYKVTINNTGITFSTIDGALWKPCIIPNCIFSGAPHGGPVAGITKLKGA